jgi:hypothetical protein
MKLYFTALNYNFESKSQRTWSCCHLFLQARLIP